jgi:hypothetical protein
MGLDPRPFRRSDDQPWLSLGVLELDPIPFPRGREIAQLDPRTGFKRPESLDRQPSVGRARQGEDRLTRLLHALQRRPPVSDPTPDRAVLGAQLVDLVQRLPRGDLDLVPSVSSRGPSAAHRSATCG